MSFFSRIKKDHTALPKYPCFYIKSNTYPKRELNSDEIIFFNEFEAELKNAKIDPFSITLTQLGGGTFNVDTPFCYVGKIGLNPITTSDKYAVMKMVQSEHQEFLNPKKMLKVIYCRKAEIVLFLDLEMPVNFICNIPSGYIIQKSFTLHHYKNVLITFHIG